MGSESPIRLRFDKAEFDEEASAAGLSCDFCHRNVVDSYYEVNGKTACASCRRQAERLRGQGFTLGKGLRALIGGSAGGAVGALIYYAVAALFHVEIGIIAIAVGLFVGFGVRWGSGGVGGRGYQILAVAITYAAIVSTYVPFIIEGFREQEKARETAKTSSAPAAGVAGSESGTAPATPPAPATEAETADVQASPGEPMSPGAFVLALGLLVLFFLAAPFLAGIQNAIGIFIIGIGLYEAWKVNRRTPVAIEGPFHVGSAPSPATPR
jgi:hypothetical protein